YGGLITGTVAGIAYVRWKKASLGTWADIIAPSLFVMQAIGRWGNFFNQELYGSPTSLPWGIAIQCGYRTQGYECPPGTDPTATLGQHFQPLFLYESISGLLGALFLIYLSRRFAHWLRPGDLLLVFFIWYGVVRFGLESLKTNNWLFFGVPTAQVVASILYRLVRVFARFVLFGLFRFRIDTSGQEHLPSAGYFLVAAAHRGWMDPFVVMHALPLEPRAWFLGSGPSTFTSRSREFLVR